MRLPYGCGKVALSEPQIELRFARLDMLIGCVLHYVLYQHAQTIIRMTSYSFEQKIQDS